MSFYLGHDYEFCKILMELSENERASEISRRVLSESIDYNSYLIFKKLDKENKNFISSKNIIDFMQENNIFLSLEESKFIFLFYDKDKDGFLSYDELISLIQSKNYKQKNINNNVELKNLTYNIEFSLTKLIEKEINLVRKLQNSLRLLKNNKFNVHEIFHSLKNSKLNIITKESLKSYLDKNNITFLDSDIDFIFNRLDINKDGIIDYLEFHTIFGYTCCNHICPCTTYQFYDNNYCNNCLLGINDNTHYLNNEYIHQKKENSFDLDINNDINKFNSWNKNILDETEKNIMDKKEEISKSLSLRLSPERKCYKNNIINVKELNTLNNFNEILQKDDILNIKEYFEILIKGEEELELLKVELALKEDFNCEKFFQLFESEEENNYITAEDLYNTFTKLDIKFNEEIINILMKRFDLLKQNKLNYNDFFDMIVSFQSKYRNLVEKRDYIDFIDENTLSLFKVLLVSIIEFEFRINNIRKKMNLNINKINELFKNIDIYDKGFIEYIDLIQYLNKNNIKYNEIGADLLFIRLDKERKGKLYINNFIDELYYN